MTSWAQVWMLWSTALGGQRVGSWPGRTGASAEVPLPARHRGSRCGTDSHRVQGRLVDGPNGVPVCHECATLCVEMFWGARPRSRAAPLRLTGDGSSPAREQIGAQQDVVCDAVSTRKRAAHCRRRRRSGDGSDRRRCASRVTRLQPLPLCGLERPQTRRTSCPGPPESTE